MALQMLYQVDLGDSGPVEVAGAFDVGDYLQEAAGVENGDRDRERLRKVAEEGFPFARRLLEGTLEHRDEIDELIRRQAENWRLERMPAIDRNILRLAVYEMRYEESVPDVVILDEAIELAKKFGTESSGRFVNGLLDGILKAAPSSPSAGGER